MTILEELREGMIFRRKLQEAAYEQALREFRAGQIREGIMAQALVRCNGDENAARSKYISMAAAAILDDYKLAQNTQDRGQGIDVTGGLCSLIFPGLGQLFQRRLLMAVFQFVLAVILWTVFLGWAVHIWSAVNAMDRGERA